MIPSVSRIVLVLALSSAIAVAQSSGGSGGSSGGSSSGGGGTRGTSTTTSTGTRGSGRNIPPVTDADSQRPIILSGRVVMDDGTPPSDRVSVERVCNGRARREAYTDSQGYFTITINNRQPMMVMQDASVGSEGLDPAARPLGAASGFGSAPGSDPTGSQMLNGCELRAVMPATVSDNIQLTGRRAFDDPNVGTIVLHRYTKTGAATVSITSLQAPDKAKKAFEKARKEQEKQNSAGAIAEYKKAVEIYPGYAEAWADLSDLYLKGKDYDNSRAAAEKSLAADARFVRPYFTLIVLDASKEDWKGTLDLTDKLLGLDSTNFPAAYYYNALANYRLHDLEKAEKSLRAARKLDVNQKLPKISLLMGTVLMDRNDYAGAVEQFQNFLSHTDADGSDAKYARDAITFSQTKIASAATPKPQQ
jgi:Flp pilus assembly protein TadD